MAFFRSRPVRWLFPPALILLVAVLTHPIWLGALGSYLVSADEPFQADIIVVLAGGWEGNRILKGAELAKQGYAPKILVSGPKGLYGWYECDIAIPFAVKKGYPAEWFVPLPNEGKSTRDEALVVVQELRRRKVRRFIVVTSDYHTRRARHCYRQVAGGLEFRMVAAPDPDFPPGGWWRSRQGQKTVFYEWTKTVAYWVGL